MLLLRAHLPACPRSEIISSVNFDFLGRGYLLYISHTQFSRFAWETQMDLHEIPPLLETEEQCLEFLESVRWPDGVCCPTCGSDRIGKVRRRNPGKNRRVILYTCLERGCRQQFSATSGTMFHDSHLPLQKWFRAINLIANAEEKVTAKSLERQLGVSYRTAWHLTQRIRKAMAEDELNSVPGNYRFQHEAAPSPK